MHHVPDGQGHHEGGVNGHCPNTQPKHTHKNEFELDYKQSDMDLLYVTFYTTYIRVSQKDKSGK